MQRLCFTFLASLSCLGFTTFPALAQIHEGNLSSTDQAMPSGAYYDVHQYDVPAGSFVIMRLNSEVFDTKLALYDDQGNQLIVNDDGGDSTNSMLGYMSPEDGTYFAVVSSYGPQETGRYTLDVELLGTETLVINTGDLNRGDTRLSDDSYYDSYRFELTEGDMFFAMAASDAFDTYLAFIDPAGQKIAESDDYDETNSCFVYEATASGTYELWVNSYAADGAGDYRYLTIEGTPQALLPSESAAPSPANTALKQMP